MYAANSRWHDTLYSGWVYVSFSSSSRSTCNTQSATTRALHNNQSQIRILNTFLCTLLLEHFRSTISRNQTISRTVGAFHNRSCDYFRLILGAFSQIRVLSARVCSSTCCFRRGAMVLDSLVGSKQQKHGLGVWPCGGGEFRVDSLSSSQHQLLHQDGPAPADFVRHDTFCDDETVPVVDVALSDSALKQTMVAACEEWGYFYLVNHGVELEIMRKVEQQAYEFFSLSVAEKAKHKAQYSLLDKVKRWSEWVTIKPAEGSLDEYDNQLSPPENNHEFSSTVKEYDAVMKKLAMRIVKLLVEGLGVKAWRFADFLEGVEATLRWNYQPPCPRPENAMGISPHTDPYLITIQHDSGIGGLQIHRKGQWLGIPPRADALIVNVGDVFEILTNGKFKSPSHRTVVNKVEGRLSVAHCMAPAGYVNLIPPPEILKFKANQYKARTYLEYLNARKRLDSCNSLEFMKLPTSV